MKISTARLKQIIKEELFYREFYRTDAVNEAYMGPEGSTKKQVWDALVADGYSDQKVFDQAWHVLMVRTKIIHKDNRDEIERTIRQMLRMEKK
jgi:hypothetical protein